MYHRLKLWLWILSPYFRRVWRAADADHRSMPRFFRYRTQLQVLTMTNLTFELEEAAKEKAKTV